MQVRFAPDVVFFYRDSPCGCCECGPTSAQGVSEYREAPSSFLGLDFATIAPATR